jgi:methylmalonyl-CoA mutase N-terminal domain/subunit
MPEIDLAMTAEDRAMTRIPNFTDVDFADAPIATGDTGAHAWLTPEGIAVKPVYGPDDLAGLDFLDTFPGIAPYLRGPYPTMYVTQPWTIRQYAVLHRRRFERLLPAQPRRRTEGPFDRVRSPHPPRL